MRTVYSTWRPSGASCASETARKRAKSSHDMGRRAWAAREWAQASRSRSVYLTMVTGWRDGGIGVRAARAAPGVAGRYIFTQDDGRW
ncbi:MAG: hypothetical protein AMXMBFR55_17730 [Gemmatimonadota bacterium]